MKHYFLPFFHFLFYFFILPWNQAISSLKGGGIQFKERCNVISMWHRDQSIHNLLPCLAFLLWSRKVAVSLLIRHKGYLLASGPIRKSSISLQTSNTFELEFFLNFFYLLARICYDWLGSNTKDALCSMGSQAVIRTTAGQKLQRHYSRICFIWHLQLQKTCSRCSLSADTTTHCWSGKGHIWKKSINENCSNFESIRRTSV